jgi:hypothetical protein
MPQARDQEARLVGNHELAGWYKQIMAKGIIVHGTISIFILVVFFLLLMYIDITSRLGVCSRTLPTMT